MSEEEPTQITGQKERETISILSYNVNFAGCGRVSGTYSQRRGGKRVEQAIEQAIHHDGCDLICLQETHRGWEKALNTSMIISSNFPHQYWDHSMIEQCKPSGAAVLAKSYLRIKVSVLQSGVEGSFFPALHIIVHDERSGDSFQVLNVHLRPPLGFDNEQKATIELSALWKTAPIRLKEIESYLEQAQKLSSLPLIILGDFNESFQSGMWNSSYADILMEKQFVDALKNETTWYWPLKWNLSMWASFDHILYKKDEFELEDRRILVEFKENAADHLPCLAKVKRR